MKMAFVGKSVIPFLCAPRSVAYPYSLHGRPIDTRALGGTSSRRQGGRRSGGSGSAFAEDRARRADVDRGDIPTRPRTGRSVRRRTRRAAPPARGHHGTRRSCPTEAARSQVHARQRRWPGTTVVGRVTLIERVACLLGLLATQRVRRRAVVGAIPARAVDSNRACRSGRAAKRRISCSATIRAGVSVMMPFASMSTAYRVGALSGKTRPSWARRRLSRSIRSVTCGTIALRYMRHKCYILYS
jgi:hypothetical protein